MTEKAEGWHNGWELGPGKLDYYIRQREAAYGEQLSTYICGPQHPKQIMNYILSKMQ